MTTDSTAFRFLVVLAIGLLCAYGPVAAGFSLPPGPWGDYGAAALKASGIVTLALAAAVGRAPLVALGLVLSAAGDVALALPAPQLLAGMGGFGLAHVVYIVCFVLAGARCGYAFGPVRALASLLLAGFSAAMFFWLAPDVGALIVPTGIYVAILTTMALTALQVRGAPIAVAGALTFVASDAVLSARLFKNIDDGFGVVVWLLYALAQVLLTVGLTRALSPAVSDRASSAPSSSQEVEPA